MNSSENLFFKINEKLEKLNNKINFLQNSFLDMKNELEIITRATSNHEYISEATLLADEHMTYFLKNRAPECQITDVCTFMIEKGIFRVLRIFNEKGGKEAIKMINSWLDKYNVDSKPKVCLDKACLSNSLNIFKTLKELLLVSEKKSMRYFEELKSLNDTSIFNEGSEEDVYRLLTPLSNVLRLKILMNLRKGGKSYTQLEEQIGIKAGHLVFHLEKLIDGGYVIQEKKRYIITMSGLKIMKFLFGLKEELLLIS